MGMQHWSSSFFCGSPQPGSIVNRVEKVKLEKELAFFSTKYAVLGVKIGVKFF